MSFTWPKTFRAAVSLSYDDALPSQLDNAIPALNALQLNASFYLTLNSTTIFERLNEWRSAAMAGHELGNHTIFHPCSKSLPDRDWVKPHHNTDTKTVEQMLEEVHIANAFLHAIDGRRERTFTVPCNDQIAKDGNYVNPLRERFVAIKGNNNWLENGFETNFMAENVSGQDMIDFVETNAAKGGVINILFHGIGGDHLSVSNEAHQSLLDYLHLNKDSLWTDSYINIMEYVKHHHASCLTES
ncbi:polysaccharide deacetylase family protein [Glaciecola sp. SC05]|uniref:polysaccharide deacetylase family protein n=1 Tax=Glaciecola sp. SC05 TaxID=1987355 RepID=UPI0035273B7B